MPFPVSAIVTIAPPTPGFTGDLAASWSLLENNMSVTFPIDVGTFGTGTILPTSDEGPFFYTGVSPGVWYGWDPVTGSYQPTVTVPTVVAPGMVMFYDASVADVITYLNPIGWYISDGGTYNGRVTKNMLDRMVIGAGNLYAPGATGGSATIPDHQHTLPDTTGGHSLTSDENGQHAHLLSLNVAEGTYAAGGTVAYTSISGAPPGTSNSGSGTPHSHPIGGSTGLAGGTSVLNPYIALVPIVYCGT